MSLHLVKLAVGVADVAELAARQAARLAAAGAQGAPPVLRHVTRQRPRRADELAAGGSLYWVVKGFIRVRQRLVACEPCRDDHDAPACALILDPALVATWPRARGPFQGWRYLAAADAPTDLPEEGAAAASAPPPGMAEELRLLGLL